jgi:hypothetical protein
MEYLAESKGNDLKSLEVFDTKRTEAEMEKI